MKHKDIAIAWLNGAEVQVLNSVKQWITLGKEEDETCSHMFDDQREYRIKPQPKYQWLYKHQHCNDIYLTPKHYTEKETDSWKHNNGWIKLRCVPESEEIS